MSSSTIMKVLQTVISNGTTISSEEIVSGFGDYEFEKWISIDSKASDSSDTGLHTAESFWQQDLWKAKDRIIIMSAFITLRRAARLVGLFEVLKERGVEIIIYTRPLLEHSGAMREDATSVIEKLRQMDIRVVQRAKMHQKVAVIDDCILWEGSLNILSQNDSGEQMRRLEGVNAVRDVIVKLDLEDPDLAAGCITERKCPWCNSQVVVKQSRYGKFYGCESYGRTGCEYKENLSKY